MNRIRRPSTRGDWVAQLPFGTVVYHRVVALYRNLEETVFPERATPAGLENARSRVFDALASAGAAARKPARFFEGSFPEVSEPGRGHPDAGYFDGLPVPPDVRAARWDQASFADLGKGAVTAVVNAEDHLALFDRSNGPFSRQWRTLDTLSSRMGAVAPFAKSEDYGYLAADPDRVGTGLELCCDVSLFGLCLARDLDASLRALDRLGFDCDPVFEPPEDDDDGGLDAPGCRYWIRSSRDAGSEPDVVGRMDAVCREVARQECHARMRLLENRSPALSDFIMRSLATGTVAELVSWAEAVDIAHAALLADDLGLLRVKARERDALAAIPTSMSDAALSAGAPEGTDLRVARAEAIRPVFAPLCARSLSR